MDTVPIPESETSYNIKETLKVQLLNRFGQVMNLGSGEMGKRSWEEVNLLGNCGEVSRITQEVVGGEIKELVHTKPGARMIYLDGQGNSKVIADGHTFAVHSYVVADDNKVWDPTLEQWGSASEEEYLSHIIKE
jgi:hypothetical protein